MALGDPGRLMRKESSNFALENYKETLSDIDDDEIE